MNNTSEFFPEENNKSYFFESLPNLLTSAHRTWKKISQNSWSEASFSRLYEIITDITSKSAFHSVEELHQSSRAIQQYLDLFISKNAMPANAQIAEIDKLFDRLDETYQVLMSTHPDSTACKKRVWMLAGIDSTVSQATRAALNPAHYEIQSLDAIRDLAGLDADSPPDIICLETASLEELQKISRQLTELDIMDNAQVPVILLSHHDDISSRLFAMRYGVSRYFAEPIETGMVIEEIDTFCKPDQEPAINVLVIEDDPTQANFAASILNKAGMHTAVVTHPLKVMDSLKSFHPDIILMDIYMPDANGLELTTIIRDDLQYLATPIVFLSGETDQDKQLDALLLGGDDFISKPIRPKHLIAIIRNRVRRTKDLIHAISLQMSDSSHIARLNPDDSNRIIQSDYLASSELSEVAAEAEPEAITQTEEQLFAAKLEEALEQKQLKPYFQPILNVQGKSDENYSLLLTYKSDEHFYAWEDIVGKLENQQLLDRYAFDLAIDAIIEIQHEEKKSMLFLPQSVHDIANGLNTDWIRDKLREKHLIGTNLALEYNLNAIAPHIKAAHQYFASLKAMGIKVCLSEFPAKKAAFKLLQYLQSDYIKTSKKLLETDSGVINTYVNQAHKLKTRVIVANISDPRYVNLHWTSLADYIHGDFISAASESMNFNFSQAAM